MIAKTLTFLLVALTIITPARAALTEEQFSQLVTSFYRAPSEENFAKLQDYAATNNQDLKAKGSDRQLLMAVMLA